MRGACWRRAPGPRTRSGGRGQFAGAPPARAPIREPRNRISKVKSHPHTLWARPTNLPHWRRCRCLGLLACRLSLGAPARRFLRIFQTDLIRLHVFQLFRAPDRLASDGRTWSETSGRWGASACCRGEPARRPALSGNPALDTWLCSARWRLRAIWALGLLGYLALGSWLQAAGCRLPGRALLPLVSYLACARAPARRAYLSRLISRLINFWLWAGRLVWPKGAHNWWARGTWPAANCADN